MYQNTFLKKKKKKKSINYLPLQIKIEITRKYSSKAYKGIVFRIPLNELDLSIYLGYNMIKAERKI